MDQDCMSGVTTELQFADVYNNIQKYPTLGDVAAALGIAYQTVKNKSTKLRKRRNAGKNVPALIWRGTQIETKVAPETAPAAKPQKLTPGQSADLRADRIRGAMQGLFTSTRYPVLNPHALVTQRRTSRRWDAMLGDHVDVATTPRTWLTETLRVEGRADVRNRKYLFTGAQNDSEIHEGFWQNLIAFADQIGAEIVIGPTTYETNWWDENSPTARDYDPAIADYLCFGQMELGDSFVFCGEMNTLATAPRPIADLTNYGRGRWAVYPHARLQLLSVPSTNPGEQAHHVMSTGFVTRPKVIPRKAGIKTLFHHVYGATLVEFDVDGDLFCRQIIADEDTGSFYDLDVFVSGGVVTTGHRVRAITFADLHLAKLGSRNAKASFGTDLFGNQQTNSLLAELDPEHILLEDIFDNEKSSHHREDDVAFHFEMAQRGRDSVRDEVRQAMTFLQLINRGPRCQIHVVESNHDVALERYVREKRYNFDGGHNVEFGLELDLAYTRYRKEVARCLDAEITPPKFSLLEHAIHNEAIASGDTIGDVHWIYDGSDSFILDGIEVGHHGHRGINGSHGTAAGFAKLGRQISIGDKHSPQILDGVYVAGAMELHHGYNKGPSGWSVTHIIQYPNGKRTLVTMQNGKWRA